MTDTKTKSAKKDPALGDVVVVLCPAGASYAEVLETRDGEVQDLHLKEAPDDAAEADRYAVLRFVGEDTWSVVEEKLVDFPVVTKAEDD